MALARRNGIRKTRESGSGEDYVPYSKVTAKKYVASALVLSGTRGVGRLDYLLYFFPLLIIDIEDRIVLKRIF
jgi:hypothetical protein